MAYVSAIEEAKKAYKTGGVEAAKRAYGNVMQEGIDAAKAPETSTSTPSPLTSDRRHPEWYGESRPPPPSTPPQSTCPPGQRLYKVSGTSGVVYVTASASASKDQIQKLAGQSGFVTAVMSPEAYSGGAYPYSREVTTVGGERYTVPYEPSLEASREYARLYGSLPGTSASKEEKDFWKATEASIQASMEEGTYVSPLVDNPVIKAYADKHGISYQSARTTLQQVANRALTVTQTPGKCGPLGMTESEATLASDYFASIGRKPEADVIEQFYVGTRPTPESQLAAAEKINYLGVFGDLAPYRVGQSYNLPLAYAEGKIDQPSLVLMGFSPEVIAGATASGSALKSLLNAPSDLYNPETGQADLSGLISTGVLTESQAGLLFRSEDVAAALASPTAAGPMIAGELRTYTDAEMAKIRKDYPLLGEKTLTMIQEGKIPVPESTEREGIGEYLLPWGSEFVGPWEEEAPTWSKALFYSSAGLLAAAGAAAFLPAIGGLGSAAIGGLKVGVGAGLPTLGIVGGASGLAKVAFTTGKVASRLGLGGLITSTTWAGIQGSQIPEKGETWEQAQARMYQEYLKSPELAAQIAAGAAEGKDLRAPTFEEYQSASGVKYEPLSYREGIWGTLGRGWEKQSEYIEGLASVAGTPSIVKPLTWAPYLASGFAGYVLSPSLAAQAYPYVGAKAGLIAIPHFGPTAIQPFIIPGTPTWQKVAGVGFSLLPYATKPLGAVFSRVGGATARVPVIGTVQRAAGGILKGAGWLGEKTGITPIMTTIERGMPWQFAYTVSEGIGRVPFPMRMPGGAQAGQIQMVPMAERAVGLGAKGTKWGWWDREVVPLKQVWGDWYGRFKAPGAAKVYSPAGKEMVEVYDPESGISWWTTVDDWTRYARGETSSPFGGDVQQPSAQQPYLPGLEPSSAEVLAPRVTSPSGIPTGELLGGRVELGYQPYLTGLELGEITPKTFSLQGSAPSAVVQEAPYYAPHYFGTEGAPAYFVNPLAKSRWYNPAWTGVQAVLPVLTVAAMSVIPGMLAQPVVGGQFVNVNLDTLKQMYEQNQITENQYSQLVDQVQQQAEVPNFQEAQEQLQQVVQESLTEEQQEQYQQQLQQRMWEEQTSPMEQLQEWQKQQWQQEWEYQQPWEYQWEGEYETDGGVPSEPPPPGIIPPLIPWLGGSPAYSGVTSTGGIRRQLLGGQWIMPGLILSMPDPFGTGRQKITLTKRKARRYGAREPVHAMGGLRI